MPPSETERVLREVGAANHGVASRRLLRRRGIAANSIDRMVRTGRLLVLRRGLYQIGPLPAAHAPEAAAVLGCGPESRVSHTSAAAMHDVLHSNRAHKSVEVTVPRRRRRRVEGVRIHRVRDLIPDEVTTVDGIPVTTPARTLLDIAETLASREVEQALAEALRRRLVTRGEMRAMVNGTRGIVVRQCCANCWTTKSVRRSRAPKRRRSCSTSRGARACPVRS
jgi:predicted transcriptional regulator of viral defense system